MNRHRILKFVIVVWVGAALMLVANNARATPQVFESPVTPTPLPSPANDNFSDATAVMGLPFSDAVNNTGATLEDGEPNWWCDYIGQTVWYSITPEVDGVIRADTSGSSFGDTGLNVYRLVGSDPGFSNLEHVGCAGWQNPVYFNVQAGTTYYLQAGGIWSGGGELHVNLQLVPPPANDNFDSATAVTELPFSDSVDNSGATAEPDEPQYCEYMARTVWYLVTPTADGVIRADTYGSSFYGTGLNVYRATGSGFGGLNHVGCAMWNSSMDFSVQAGETYYVQAGGMGSSSGELHVNLQQFLAPPNDDFAGAMAVPNLPFGDTVDTAGATTEAGEPRPSSCWWGNTVGTVWYAFTPETSGSVSARANAWFPTVLAAYTGTSLADLTEIGCRNYWGLLTFHVDAGTTYYFQAGDLWGERGWLEFHLDVAPPPVASFGFYPSDPSVFDTVQFNDWSWDPGEVGIQAQAWDLGDGTTATGCCPAHQYAADGDYTVGLMVTTYDGRTASTSQVVQVRTHDVAIVRLSAPQAARVGQTRQIAVEVNSKRYPENVEVQIFKSVPGGFQWFGTLTQAVPVRSANRTTRFSFSYTFTSDDARIGKVTFKAVANILNARDALPADNEAISSPTKVSR